MLLVIIWAAILSTHRMPKGVPWVCKQSQTLRHTTSGAQCKAAGEGGRSRLVQQVVWTLEDLEWYSLEFLLNITKKM